MCTANEQKQKIQAVPACKMQEAAWHTACFAGARCALCTRRLVLKGHCLHPALTAPAAPSVESFRMSHVFPPPRVPCVPVQGIQQTFPVHRIYCVGRNYAEHAKEMGFTGREPPFFFMKPADAVHAVSEGTTGTLPYPSLTTNLHPEIELVVAIGKGGKDIAEADAVSHIFGYAVGLDMTRRDLQGDMKKQGRPWCIGKGFDHSAPIGPITPAAQAPGAEHAAIRLQVNGEERQRSSTAQLIWSVAETIAHLSAAWELQPGDLIFTGTPEGVAAVQRGDRLECSVEGLVGLRLEVA